MCEYNNEDIIEYGFTKRPPHRADIWFSGNGMIFGACHFLCHQFTQRDEPDQIIADMVVLVAFSAAFVRGSDIDRLYQFMGRVRC